MTAELHPYLRDTIEAANATTVPPDWRLMVGKTSSVYLGPRLSDTNGVWLRICYPFGDQPMWRFDHELMGAPGKPETLLWSDRWGSLQEAVDACIEAMEVTGR